MDASALRPIGASLTCQNLPYAPAHYNHQHLLCRNCISLFDLGTNRRIPSPGCEEDRLSSILYKDVSWNTKYPCWFTTRRNICRIMANAILWLSFGGLVSGISGEETGSEDWFDWVYGTCTRGKVWIRTRMGLYRKGKFVGSGAFFVVEVKRMTDEIH